MALDRTGPREVTQAQSVRLENWAARKPSVALMGEFSAGKSSLLNFLIDSEVLPTQITATELPTIWFSHGTEGSFWVDQEWNQYPLDLANLKSVPITARFAKVFLQSKFLETCDLIDTPGISDPNLPVEPWRVAAGYSDMVIWCTTATQAWRETENATWKALPARLRRHSLLVVTRADKLQSELDREKVARRLRRETGDMFVDTIFVATPDAVRAKKLVSDGAHTPLWAQSGAAAITDALDEQFDAIRARRQDMLSRYVVLTGDRRPVLKLARAIPASLVPSPENLEPIRPSRVSRPDGGLRAQRPLADYAVVPPVEEVIERPFQTAAASDANPTVDAEIAEPEIERIETRDVGQAPEPMPDAAPVQADEVAEAAQPRAVGIWKDIVSRYPGNPTGEQILAMIGQLLAAMAPDPSAETGKDRETPPADKPEVAPVRLTAELAPVIETARPGWRRLA